MELAVFYYALFSWRARPEPGFSSAKTKAITFSVDLADEFAAAL